MSTDNLDRTLAALADPHRRRVVDLLRAQDAAGTADPGDPAGQIDGRAVVVPGADGRRTERDSGPEAR